MNTMNEFRIFLRGQISKYFLFIIILIIYIVLGLILFGYYQYQINDDGIMLISIALKYYAGDIQNAINGYWGPLFSWILLNFIFFGKEPFFLLISSKALSLIIGFIMIIGLHKLSHYIDMEEKIRILILFVCTIAILSFALIVTTSDLLMSCILIYYFNFLFDKKYLHKISYGFFCGLLGALAYLSKAYAFPFFIFHFTIFNLIFYLHFKSERKNIFKIFSIGIFIFFVISGVWMFIISEKYNSFTIGTSGEYNHALVGPESQGHPMHYLGFIKPPNNSAISAWEDPSYFKMERWNFYGSWDNLKHQMGIISINILKIILIIEYFSFLSILIIICSLIFFLKKFIHKEFFNISVYFFLSFLIYSVGYVFVLVEERYLWIDYFILILLGGFFLNRLLKISLIKTNYKKYFLIVAFLLSFILTPMITLSDGMSYVSSQKELYFVSKELNDKGVNGNIASIGGYYYSLYLSYFLESKYYGESQPNISSKDLKKDLDYHKINYLFVWNNAEDKHIFLKDYTMIYERKFHNNFILKIYVINSDLNKKNF